MKALTVQMPYAQLIMERRKTIEVRSKPTKLLSNAENSFSNPILLCVGKKPFDDDFPPENKKILGHAVAVFEITECIPFQDEPEFWRGACLDPLKLWNQNFINPRVNIDVQDMSSVWAWRIDVLFEIDPFPVRGMPGFFDVDDALVEGLTMNNPLEMTLDYCSEYQAYLDGFHKNSKPNLENIPF